MTFSTRTGESFAPVDMVLYLHPYYNAAPLVLSSVEHLKNHTATGYKSFFTYVDLLCTGVRDIFSSLNLRRQIEFKCKPIPTLLYMQIARGQLESRIHY